MKPFIISIFLLFICSFADAQVDSVDTQELKHIIYKDVKDVIKSLSETLKVGTEHVYEVLVKQQIVESIVFLIVLVLGVGMLIMCFKLFLSLQFEILRDNYHSTLKDESIGPLIFAIALAVIGCISLLVGIAHLNEIITGFVNPEYGAIKTIVEMLK